MSRRRELTAEMIEDAMTPGGGMIVDPRDFLGYPETVEEVLADDFRFKRETLQAVRNYKNAGPWTGTTREREAKLRDFHAALCDVYGKSTSLRLAGIVLGSPAGSSGSSTYEPATDIITIRNKLSVVTYLHEFAHSLGKGERGACRWSLNLFRKVFPEKWARLSRSGHTVRR